MALPPRYAARPRPGSDLGHGHLRQIVVTFTLQTTSPALTYEAIKSRIPISGRVVAGSGQPGFWSHPTASGTSHARSPELHDPTDDRPEPAPET